MAYTNKSKESAKIMVSIFKKQLRLLGSGKGMDIERIRIDFRKIAESQIKAPFVRDITEDCVCHVIETLENMCHGKDFDEKTMFEYFQYTINN